MRIPQRRSAAPLSSDAMAILMELPDDQRLDRNDGYESFAEGATHMRWHVEIVPNRRGRLFESLVKRESELADRNRGTFFRSGRKMKSEARWKHKRYAGWLKITRMPGEIVAVDVYTRTGRGAGWQLL